MLDISSLPQISRGEASFVNRAISARPGLSVDFAAEADAEAVRLGIGLTDDWPAGTAFQTLRVAGDIGDFFLQASTDAVDALSDVMLPGWRDENSSALPPVWRGIYAAGMVIGMTALAGEPFEIAPGDADPADYPSFVNLAISIGDAEHVVWIGMRAADPAKLSRLVPPSASEAHQMRDIPIRARPQSHVRTVPIETLSSLVRGDVILFDAEPGTIPAWIHFGRGTRLLGSLERDGRFVIGDADGKDAIMDDELRNDASFDDEPSNEETLDGSGEVSEPNALEHASEQGISVPEHLGMLPVDVEIAHLPVTLRLSEVSSLGAGSVLDLRLDLSASVEVRANGERVGRGRLVQIGESVGVQISQWSSRWGSDG